MQVQDIMTTTVITVHRDTLVSEVAELFVAKALSGAPIIDDLGDVAGFVSKSDIVRFNLMKDEFSDVAVHEISSPQVIFIAPEASIAEAATKILAEHVHHLVVADGEGMVGMLSTLDFVQIAATNDVQT